MKPLVIVGCGPGDGDYLTAAARKAVETAEVLDGADHLLALFPEVGSHRIEVTGAMAAVLDQLEPLRQQHICVLVSGDSGLFSLAQLVIGRFGRENCRVIPGISSVQVAFSRLALSWSSALLISAHGRLPQQTTAELAAYDRIALLAGDAAAINWTADQLAQLGDTYLVVSCENLTLADETIRQFSTADELRRATFPSRTVLLLLKKELLQ
jgi:cobalt-precorrin-7 (C5)-methyltransferase